MIRRLALLCALLCLSLSTAHAQLFDNPFTVLGSGTSRFGLSVENTGDINGDGFEDVMVGAPNFINLGGTGAPGFVYIYSGQNGALLRTLGGSSNYDNFGVVVAAAGDVNNDGVPDQIIGAPNADFAGMDAGRATVYSGTDGSVLYTFDGDGPMHYMGTAVTGAGDVNNDGFDDLAASMPFIGAPAGSGGGTGVVRIFSGADGSQLYELYGSSASQFGTSLEGPGDLNNDGFDDLAVGDSVSQLVTAVSGVDGSVLFSAGSAASGFGHALSSIEDLGGDGNPDLLVTALPGATVTIISSAAGAVIDTIIAPPGNLNFGSGVDAMPDMNGDGTDEIVVGMHGQIAFPPFFPATTGLTFIYSGADRSLIDTLVADNDSDYFGFAVAGGDFNADGLGDCVVGMPLAVGGVAAGGLKVYHAIPAAPLPVCTYAFDPSLGITLFQSWAPDGGNINALTGTLVVSGATPGGVGLYGISLAPGSFQLPFGFPLLIANDPVNLIETGNFGFSLAGDLILPGVSRQFPAIAGIYVFMQFYELSPIIRGSNGLKMLMAP